jgi:hypothetical protein
LVAVGAAYFRAPESDKTKAIGARAGMAIRLIP